MRDDKQKAKKLRLKGYSYNEIKEKLGIPKSTQSGWFKELKLPDKAKERLEKRKTKGTKHLIKRNKRQTKKAKKKAEKIKKKASSSIKELTHEELKLIGCSLYWAEGYKRQELGCTVSLANSDPKLVAVFMKFLRQVCKVSNSRFRAQLFLYDNIKEEEAKDFWTEVTDIPKTQFQKTQTETSISSKRDRPHNRLPYGTIQIRVSDTDLFHKIMGWTKGIKQQL